MWKYLWLFLLVIAVGCAGSANVSPDSRSKDESSKGNQGGFPSTMWDLDAIGTHLAYFNSSEVEGRATGSRGFLRAANYISNEMKLAGLQPVLANSYRHQYASQIRVWDRADIRLVGADTLQLVPGRDVLVGIPYSNTEGTLSSEIVKRMSRQTYVVRRNVAYHSEVTTSTIHVSGMIPGRYPVQRDSLILIVAAVDGLGQQGVDSYTDGSDSGIAAAALLEVMNRISETQDTWSLYGPTIMIGFLSGSEGDCLGPEAAFRNVPWQKSRLLRIIALQDNSGTTCDWHGMAEKEGIASRLEVFTVPGLQIPLDNTMPFYPYIRRDKWLRLAGPLRLANETAWFADLVFNSLSDK